MFDFKSCGDGFFWICKLLICASMAAITTSFVICIVKPLAVKSSMRSGDDTTFKSLHGDANSGAFHDSLCITFSFKAMPNVTNSRCFIRMIRYNNAVIKTFCVCDTMFSGTLTLPYIIFNEVVLHGLLVAWPRTASNNGSRWSGVATSTHFDDRSPMRTSIFYTLASAIAVLCFENNRGVNVEIGDARYGAK